MDGRDTDEAGTSGAHTSDACDLTDGPVRLVLSVALPCGIGECRRPAREALAEPDPTNPGTWVLLPICSACAANFQATPHESAESA